MCSRPTLPHAKSANIYGCILQSPGLPVDKKKLMSTSLTLAEALNRVQSIICRDGNITSQQLQPILALLLHENERITVLSQVMLLQENALQGLQKKMNYFEKVVHSVKPDLTYHLVPISREEAIIAHCRSQSSGEFFHQWRWENHNSQWFHVTTDDSGYYMIKNIHSNLYLFGQPDDTVLQLNKNMDDWGKFLIERVSGTVLNRNWNQDGLYKVQCKANGKVLTVSDRLRLAPWVEGSTQKWDFRGR